jgi:hypothetical protein
VKRFGGWHSLSAVTAGLDPAIHDEFPCVTADVFYPVRRFIMDARVKPAHDAEILARLE